CRFFGERGTENRACFAETIAIAGFPGAEQKKRNERGGDPQLGLARNFFLWFPAEDLPAHEEGQKRGAAERGDLRAEMRQRRKLDEGALEPGDQIGGGEKQRDLLQPSRQAGEGNGHAGKQNKG